jgi:UDP-N-acetylmuramoyl-tripeptide--D-alanyl-D-alanine ligase
LKSFYLLDILKVIEGRLIQGENILINDAAAGLWAVENSNTMYFHLSRRNYENLEFLKKYKSIAIITEDTAQFAALGEDFSIIKVDNIKNAYWKFVDYYRSLFDIPIIGITGTCGKSTTKEMIAHILSSKYSIKATRLSNNSSNFDFSYLLGIDDTTQAAVFEMGVDRPGNLAYSCRHFKPQIRILLNIGVYHLVGCKTLAGYIKAKSEILEGLDPVSEILILNSDDENIKKIDVSKFQRIVYFGLNNKSNFTATDIETLEDAVTFTLHHADKNYKVYLPGLGKHNVYNALAAVAAVSNAGIEIEEAVERLMTYKPMARHLQLRKGPLGSVILDDNFNNTPPSMASALEVLKDAGKEKFKIAVLGHMYNLGTGAIAKEQYSEMGEKVVEAGVDLLVVIGQEPVEIGLSALAHGMSKDKVIFINSGNEVLNTIKPFLNENTIVLLKACEDKVVL